MFRPSSVCLLSSAFSALRSHIERIGKESANFRAGLHSEYRPSDKDFPRIIYNNRPGTKHFSKACHSSKQ